MARRSDVVSIDSNDASLVCLAGPLLLEQNDERLVGRRYLSAESLAGLYATEQVSKPERPAPSRGRWCCSRPNDPDDDQELHHVKGLDPSGIRLAQECAQTTAIIQSVCCADGSGVRGSPGAQDLARQAHAERYASRQGLRRVAARPHLGR
jgi:hypothetical protein